MKILIGTPNYTGEMTSDVAVSIARCIMEWSKDHEVKWSVIKRTFICKARQMIVQDALTMGADYLFWVDDDAIVKPSFLPKLIAHDKDIIVTPYPMRRPPFQCGALRSKTGNFEDQDQYENLRWEDLNQGLVEIDGGGTHCMLTKTSIYGPPSEVGETFETYTKKHPGKVPYPWFVLAPFGGTEDMYMCLLAKRAGIKIYCDTDIESQHIGYPQIISSGNYYAWTKKYGDQEIHQVLEKLPEGSQYIDVSDAENSGVTPTTGNTSAVNADQGNGSAQVI